VACVLVALAVTGCGDDPKDAPATDTGTTPSKLAVRVAELETGITEYCEITSSGRVTAAQREQAVADVRELIALTRRDPDAMVNSTATVRDALVEVSTVLSADCRDPRLQRRVDRALDSLRQ
jgi:hypothetical protein